MVVIVILGLLATIVIINVMPAMDRAAATTARADISQIEQGLEMYKLDNRRYPTSEEGLAALVPGTDPPAAQRSLGPALSLCRAGRGRAAFHRRDLGRGRPRGRIGGE